MISTQPNFPKVISRIFITETGDLIVTDLWEEIREMLTSEPDKHVQYCELTETKKVDLAPTHSNL